jgi:hypothetical protein
MPRGKKKPISFDAMVKFFMHQYKIPTTKDVEKITARLDRLEKLLKQASAPKRKQRSAKAASAAGRGKAGENSTDVVFKVIAAGKGVGVAEIQKRTGYDPKKIRNIIFRLGKNKKIVRVSRGIYTAA